MKKIVFFFFVLFLALIGSSVKAQMNFNNPINGGYQAKNDKSNVQYPTQATATYEYGWEWNGPFTATVLSGTATILSLKTTAGLPAGYQGPLALVGFDNQATVCVSAGNANAAPAGLGIPFAVSTTVNTVALGALWSGSNSSNNSYTYLQLTPTVVGTTGNFVYWILDKNW